MKKEHKILLVEDNDMITSLIESELADETLTVMVARDGEEGIQKIFSEKPDLIVLDIVLPKKDGIAVLEAIHAKNPNFNTPVIVLSNSNDMNHIASAMNHHVVAYLVKSDQALPAIAKTIRANLPQ